MRLYGQKGGYIMKSSTFPLVAGVALLLVLLMAIAERSAG